MLLDVEALALADTLAPLECLREVARRALGFAQVAVDRAAACVRQGEVRVQLDRRIDEGNRLDLMASRACFGSLAEGSERFERGRRRLIDRGIELLDRGQGFPQPPAQPRGRFADRAQDLLFAGSLDLLTGQ